MGQVTIKVVCNLYSRTLLKTMKLVANFLIFLSFVAWANSAKWRREDCHYAETEEACKSVYLGYRCHFSVENNRCCCPRIFPGKRAFPCFGYDETHCHLPCHMTEDKTCCWCPLVGK